TKAEHSGLDGGNAVGDEACHGYDRLRLSEGAVGNNHGGSTAVEARCIAGRYSAAFSERRAELGEARPGRIRPRGLVGAEQLDAFLAADLDRDDFVGELAGSLCRAETLLGAFGKPVLRLARQLRLRHQIFGVPARMLAREGVIEAIAKHTVMNL